MTYHPLSPSRPLIWFVERIATSPFSTDARRAAGRLLRILQRGGVIGMPRSRPMPVIGPRCHELRLVDQGVAWRILYRTDPDAVLVLGIFAKRSQATPRHEIEQARRRLAEYDRNLRSPRASEERTDE